MELMIDGRGFRLEAPRWGRWQAALDRAVTGTAGADPERLLIECLLASVQTADGGSPSRHELAGLSSEAGDQLLAGLMDLLDRERAELQLEVSAEAGAGRIWGQGVDLQLRTWTFGERNAALRRSLRLQDDQVVLDISAFELQMALQCVMHGDGRGLGPAEVLDWPVPVGEAVFGVLDRLNGVDAHEAEILQTCVRTGRSHPDVTMVELCQAFGWSPADVERLDARTAERLWTAWRLLKGAAAAPAPQSSAVSAADEEGVTRIIVQDH